MSAYQDWYESEYEDGDRASSIVSLFRQRLVDTDIFILEQDEYHEQIDHRQHGGSSLSFEWTFGHVESGDFGL